MKKMSSELVMLYNETTGQHEPVDMLHGESAYEAAVRHGLTTLSEVDWLQEYVTKRDSAIKAIEDTGSAVLESIPDEYEELSEQVATLTEEMNDLNVTQNMLNKDAVTHGYIGKLDSMSPVVNTAMYMSGYIPVQGGVEVVVNQHLGSGYYGHIIYDADRQAISAIPSNANNLRMTMPEGAAYIRVSGAAASIDEMIVLVLTSNFEQRYVNDAVADFLVEPENLFDASDVTKGYGRAQNNGSPIASEGLYYSGMIPVKPYQIYRIAIGYASAQTGHCWYRIRQEDGEAVYLSGIAPNGEYGSDSGYKLVQAPAEAAFLTISGNVTEIGKQSVCAVRMQDSKRLLAIEREADLLEDSENLFDGYVPGYFRNTTGNPAASDAGYYSELIKVEPGTYYKIGKGFKTGYYGHVFYDWDYNLIEFVSATGDYAPDGYKIIKAPEGAVWLSISGMLSDVRFQTIHALRVQGTDKMTALSDGIERLDEYKRYTIKHTKWPTDGYRHQAFPSACYWGGNAVLVSRVSDDHLTPTDESLWGGLVFDMQSPDGRWTHKTKLTKADFDGLDGEIRDPQIQPTRDGSALILATWTTYYDANGNDIHDNLLAVLDENMNVTDHLVTKNASHIYWGNPLITPDGHLIVTGYSSGTVVLYRSKSAFSDKVSTLIFDTITLASGGANPPSEACVGYYNDKLVCLIRRDGVPSLMTVTNDLEGVSGWTEPVSIGIELHAPKLLPYCKGDYLFFGGAYLHHFNSWSDCLRYACIGYLDVDNAKVIAHGQVDVTQTYYSGYCGIVPFGGEEYGVVYYQEGVQTALYYKRVNARNLIPQMCYYI